MNDKKVAWGVQDTKGVRLTQVPEREHPNACRRRKKRKRRQKNKAARKQRKR